MHNRAADILWAVPFAPLTRARAVLSSWVVAIGKSEMQLGLPRPAPPLLTASKQLSTKSWGEGQSEVKLGRFRQGWRIDFVAFASVRLPWPILVHTDPNAALLIHVRASPHVHAAGPVYFRALFVADSWLAM